jgi:hypothetical protein
LTWLRENVRQLVGEAARLEAAGASFDIPRDVWGDAAERQEAARGASDIETLLGDWFAQSDMAGPLTYVLASDVIHLEKTAGLRNATGLRSAVMRKLGFRSEKPMIGGKRTTVWARGHFALIADIPRSGVRYVVGQDNHGRPQVHIRAPGAEHGTAVAPINPLPAIPGPR